MIWTKWSPQSGAVKRSWGLPGMKSAYVSSRTRAIPRRCGQFVEFPDQLRRGDDAGGVARGDEEDGPGAGGDEPLHGGHGDQLRRSPRRRGHTPAGCRGCRGPWGGRSSRGAGTMTSSPAWQRVTMASQNAWLAPMVRQSLPGSDPGRRRSGRSGRRPPPAPRAAPRRASISRSAGRRRPPCRYISQFRRRGIVRAPPGRGR